MEWTQFDQTWIAAHAPGAALVLARVIGLCVTAPVTAVPGTDGRMRIVIAVILGAVLVPLIEPLVGPLPGGAPLAWLALTELVVGGLLGLSAGLIVAGARQAGDLVAAQAGLSTSALFDPETGEELTALGHLYGLIAVAVFLAMKGPLVLIASLMESYRTIPAGGLILGEPMISRAFEQVGAGLALSLHAAAPVAVALAVAGIVTGWIGRLAPAVPLLTLSLPVRSILGIVLVFLSLGTLVAVLSRAWGRWPG